MVKSAGLPKKDAEKIDNENVTTMWESLFQEDLMDKEKTNTLEEIMEKVSNKQDLLPECVPDAPCLYKDMTDGEYTSAMEQLFSNADVTQNDKLSPEEMKAFCAGVMKAANITPEAIDLVINQGKFDQWSPAEDFMNNDKWASWEEFKAALPTMKDDILKGCPNKPKETDIQLFNEMSEPHFDHVIH
jgi:hypothetical protein